MRKVPSLLLLLAVVIVIAACAASLSLGLFGRWQRSAHDDAHAWVHTRLELTAAQREALGPIEGRYHDARTQLEGRMQAANVALADAILADGRETTRVHDAIERIHVQMGDLQKLTIGHVFEMRDVLSPEQYDTLMRMTADALRNLDEQSEDGEPHHH
ncbi:MAG: periplasmic heavy metal sensor [Chthoniobacterales bacterium]